VVCCSEALAPPLIYSVKLKVNYAFNEGLLELWRTKIGEGNEKPFETLAAIA
jgi:hypothetical protein